MVLFELHSFGFLFNSSTFVRALWLGKQRAYFIDGVKFIYTGRKENKMFYFTVKFKLSLIYISQLNKDRCFWYVNKKKIFKQITISFWIKTKNTIMKVLFINMNTKIKKYLNNYIFFRRFYELKKYKALQNKSMWQVLNKHLLDTKKKKKK